METSNTITQKRYNCLNALNSVPNNKISEVKEQLKKLLDIKSGPQLYRIVNGKSQTTLAKAKAVEEYFLKTWCITEVWVENSETN